ncbi:MAG: response regulator [Calditrichia bacterium]
MISVSLVEDNRDIREGLHLLIDGTPNMFCLASYSNCDVALKEIVGNAPEVLLLDIEMPGRWGVEALPDIRKACPDTDILMLTVHEEDELVFQALSAGACGYLVKTTPPLKLIAAIHEVANGGAPMTAHIARRVLDSFHRPAPVELTTREAQILQLLCRGDSYKMIAASLGISRGTVHGHIKSIYRKLEVNSSSQAVARALQDKLV